MVQSHGHVPGERNGAFDGGIEPRKVAWGGNGSGKVVQTGTVARSAGPVGSQGASSVAWREGKAGHVWGHGLRRGDHGLRRVGTTGCIVAGVHPSAGRHGGCLHVVLLQLLKTFLAVLAAEADTAGALLFAEAGTSILEPNLQKK